MRNVRWLSVEDALQLVVRAADARADKVPLVLPRKLATGDQEIRAVVPHGGARAIAEPTEPNEEILLELCRFLLAQLIVRNKRDMDKAESLVEDSLNFFLEKIFRRRMRAHVVRDLHYLFLRALGSTGRLPLYGRTVN
jgi:hypothetical protein